MGSYNTDSAYREENIKTLDDHIIPTVLRDGFKVLSVGMKDGQRYYNYDKTKGKITSSNIYDKSAQEAWKRGYYYDLDIANLIDQGYIYIEYVPIVEIEEVEIIDNQLNMF